MIGRDQGLGGSRGGAWAVIGWGPGSWAVIGRSLGGGARGGAPSLRLSPPRAWPRDSPQRVGSGRVGPGADRWRLSPRDAEAADGRTDAATPEPETSTFPRGLGPRVGLRGAMSPAGAVSGARSALSSPVGREGEGEGGAPARDGVGRGRTVAGDGRGAPFVALRARLLLRGVEMGRASSAQRSSGEGWEGGPARPEGGKGPGGRGGERTCAGWGHPGGAREGAPVRFWASPRRFFPILWGA